MPFPPHFRLEWGGDFVSDPLEIWSNGINMTHDSSVDGSAFPSEAQGGSQALLDHYSAKVVTHFTATNTGYSSNVRLKYVKFNEILPTGLRKNSTVTWRKDIGGSTGTPGQNLAVGPITTSCVVTFLTDAGRGRASRGRCFVPHPNLALASTTYRYATAGQTGVVNGWLTFLNALTDGPGVDVPNSLVPSVVTELETPGLFRNIRAVQVGDFPDYMGSRRNRLKETRLTSAAMTNAP